MTFLLVVKPWCAVHTLDRTTTTKLSLCSNRFWLPVESNQRGAFMVPGCATTVYPKKYAHGFCFAVLCCGYTLTDFPIFIRLTSLALWQSNNCPSASKATLMNMDKYFMWIHYDRLHSHKAKHNKTVRISLGIYSTNPRSQIKQLPGFFVRDAWRNSMIY